MPQELSTSYKINKSIFIRSVAITALLLSVTEPVSAQNQSAPAAAKGDRDASSAPVQESNKPSVTLPNGASAISETFGDWTVNCSIADNQKRCAFRQEHGNAQTGERSFAIELLPVTAEGQTTGVLLLPFGLHLDGGVKLKLDEQNLGQGARFSTCLPAGCLVPVSFPKVATDAMKKGEKLIIIGAVEGGGDVPVFTVSLNGFTTAMNRVTELSK